MVLQPNEKIYVKSYFVDTEEDIYTEGCVGGVCCMWSNKDIQVDGRYDTAAEALQAVLKANCFDDEYGAEQMDGYFVFSFLVDVNNYQASKNDIALWKRGKKRLWLASMYITLGIVAERSYFEEVA